jgi:pimeloyl-ACP methyl ester carboxylesterase
MVCASGTPIRPSIREVVSQARGLPSSKIAPAIYQVWENVSHFLMMEKPREFNAALSTFLEKNQLMPNRS